MAVFNNFCFIFFNIIFPDSFSLFYNHSIQVEIPDFSKDKNILWLTECSKEKNKLITGENIYSVRLDDNETAYIAGQQLKIRMTELGYKLETVE